MKMNQYNEIIHGDAIEVMSEMDADTVDAAVIDPPYNLSEDSEMDFDGDGDGAFGGEWEQTDESWDKMGFGEFMEFNRKWLSEVKRVVKPGGAVWVFGTYHNIGHINVLYQELGIETLNEIIWYKPNAFPNLAQSCFTASHENILWGTVPGDDYTFNYDEIKASCDSADAFDERGKQVRSVWNIPNNKESWELEHGKHPTQKPASVIRRALTATTGPGDVVFDPFAGSGTTCVVAKRHGRGYLGIDREGEYVELARKRIANVVEPDQENAALTW